MSFKFDYYGLTYKPGGCGIWVSQGDYQIAIMGGLKEGTIELGDRIALNTTAGIEVGYVARFAESFYEWFGMPFYNKLTTEYAGVDPFCICIGFEFEPPEFVCPGIATLGSEIVKC